MKLEPGMRVRCVDAGSNLAIHTGGNYVVDDVNPLDVRLTHVPFWYCQSRFKPVVRVKAPSFYFELAAAPRSHIFANAGR